MTLDDIIAIPVPEDRLNCATAFARDLVIGVVQGWWNMQFYVITRPTMFYWSDVLTNLDKIGFRTDEEWENEIMMSNPQRLIDGLMKDKWANGTAPDPLLLQAYGYVQQNGSSYILTTTAFDLLNKPAAPPNIFISYRRRPHAALALLVEARLKMAGAVPFLDKDLVHSANEWHGKLETQIKESEYLIALIGENAFEEGSFTVQELAWAREAGLAIIPVLDNLTVEDAIKNGAPPDLFQWDVVFIRDIRALDYETGISHILNKLGYATY